MDEARAAHLRENYSSDELIEELDRRLREQGINTEVGGVEITVDYLREGWTVLALPPELAERVAGSMATPTTLYALANELRQMIAGRKNRYDESELRTLAALLDRAEKEGLMMKMEGRLLTLYYAPASFSGERVDDSRRYADVGDLVSEFCDK